MKLHLPMNLRAALALSLAALAATPSHAAVTQLTIPGFDATQGYITAGGNDNSLYMELPVPQLWNSAWSVVVSAKGASLTGTHTLMGLYMQNTQAGNEAKKGLSEGAYLDGGNLTLASWSGTQEQNGVDLTGYENVTFVMSRAANANLSLSVYDSSNFSAGPIYTLSQSGQTFGYTDLEGFVLGALGDYSKHPDCPANRVDLPDNPSPFYVTKVGYSFSGVVSTADLESYSNINSATLTWNGGASGRWEGTVWHDSAGNSQAFSAHDTVIFNSDVDSVELVGATVANSLSVNGNTTINLAGNNLETNLVTVADGKTFKLKGVGTATIGLVSGGSVNVDGSTLTVANAISNTTLAVSENSTLRLTGTQLSNTTITGKLELTGRERITLSGNVTLGRVVNELTNSTSGYAFVGDSGVTLTFTGQTDLTKKGDGVTATTHSSIGLNQGKLIVASGASLTTAKIYNSSTLANNANVTVEEDGSLVMTSDDNYLASLTNSGTVTAADRNTRRNIKALQVVNDGTLTAGTLEIDNTNGLTSALGGTVNVTSLQVDRGTAEISGNVTVNTGALEARRSNVNVDEGGMLAANAGILIGHPTNGDNDGWINLRGGEIVTTSIKGQNNNNGNNDTPFSAFTMTDGTLTIKGTEAFGLTADEKKLAVKLQGGTIKVWESQAGESQAAASTMNLAGTDPNGNLKFEIGNVTFDTGTGNTINLNHDFTQTGTLTVTGSGTLSLSGNVTLSDINALSAAGYTDKTDTGNGYAGTNRYLIMMENGTGGTSPTLSIADNFTIADANGTTLTYVSDEYGTYIQTEAENSDKTYYINTGDVTYWDIEHNNAAADETTGIVLNGGNLILNKGLTEQAQTGTGIVVQQAATVTINVGVTLAQGDLTAHVDTQLAGSGSFALGSSSLALPDNVRLGSGWEGTVYVENVAFNNDANNSVKLATLANANSWVGLTGCTGWLQNGSTIAANLRLQDGDAIKLTNGYGGATQSFTGNIEGSGNFVVDMGSGSTVDNVTYVFSGDVSKWTGTFKSPNTTTGKIFTLQFTGAGNIGTSIDNETGRTLEVTIGGDGDRIMTGSIANTGTLNLTVEGDGTKTFKGTQEKSVTVKATTMDIQEGTLAIGDYASVTAGDVTATANSANPGTAKKVTIGASGITGATTTNAESGALQALGEMSGMTLDFAAANTAAAISHVTMRDVTLTTSGTVTYTNVKAVAATMGGAASPTPYAAALSDTTQTLTATPVQSGGTASGTLTVDIDASILSTSAGKTLSWTIFDGVSLASGENFTLELGDVLATIVGNGKPKVTLSGDWVNNGTHSVDLTSDNLDMLSTNSLITGNLLVAPVGDAGGNLTLTIENVPEPRTGALFVLALAALVTRRRRRE